MDQDVRKLLSAGNEVEQQSGQRLLRGIMKMEKPDASLYPKTDAELAADLRQLWQEKVRYQRELERRGYDVNCVSYYGTNTTDVNINKVAKDVL